MLLNAGPLFEEVCRLCREAVLPVFGSSANLSGTGPRFRVEDIQPEIRAIADITVDYGLRKHHVYRRSATILRFGNGDPECVRIGSCYELIADVLRRHFKVELPPDHTITAAAQCGGEVHVLIVGHNADAAAQSAAQVVGVAKVLLADAPQFGEQLAEPVTEQVLTVAKNYTHLLFPASARGKNVAPRVAALLDVAQVSEITKVVAPDTFERPIYAGNAIATVRSSDATKVITVRTTGFEAAPASGGKAAVEPLAVVSDAGTSSFVGREVTKSDRPELTAARVIVSGGRALGSSDKFNEVLTPLADKLGAALGASRAAVDAGYAPNDWQVGQTGKIVAPQLYIAAGISGAIQHLAGMKDSKVIVAINKDAEAPIFAVADYGLEADLFTAVPEIAASL
jgi:electron transfer flavoprotein alpha subunit